MTLRFVSGDPNVLMIKLFIVSYYYILRQWEPDAWLFLVCSKQRAGKILFLVGYPNE